MLNERAHRSRLVRIAEAGAPGRSRTPSVCGCSQSATSKVQALVNGYHERCWRHGVALSRLDVREKKKMPARQTPR